MSDLGFTYKASEIPVDEGDGDFAPLPNGWYTAKVTDAQLKDTRAGTGRYINVRYDIMGPTHQGRVVFGMLNIQNQNDVAERIGVQQLGSLLRSIGVEDFSDTDQLIGGECQIRLATEKSAEYGDKNKVTAWKAMGDSPAAKPAAAPTPTQGSGSTPPWIKK